MLYRFRALSSTLRDKSKWVCWLTGRENEDNSCTASNTIASEAISATDFPSSLEQSGNVAKCTASVFTMCRISIPNWELLRNKFIRWDKCCKPWYRGSDVNLLSKYSFIFFPFRYLSSQVIFLQLNPRATDTIHQPSKADRHCTESIGTTHFELDERQECADHLVMFHPEALSSHATLLSCWVVEKWNAPAVHF